MERDPKNEESGLIRRCFSLGAGHALEIGCGDGRLTDDLARFGDQLVAVGIKFNH